MCHVLQANLVTAPYAIIVQQFGASTPPPVATIPTSGPEESQEKKYQSESESKLGGSVVYLAGNGT